MNAQAWLLHSPTGEVIGVIIAEDEQDANREVDEFDGNVDYVTGPLPASVSHEWVAGV